MKKSILSLLLVLPLLLCSCDVSYQNDRCQGCKVTYEKVDNIEKDDAEISTNENGKYAIVYLNDVDSRYVISVFNMTLDGSELDIQLKSYDVNKTGEYYDLFITIELDGLYKDYSKSAKISWKIGN